MVITIATFRAQVPFIRGVGTIACGCLKVRQPSTTGVNVCSIKRKHCIYSALWHDTKVYLYDDIMVPLDWLRLREQRLCGLKL